MYRLRRKPKNSWEKAIQSVVTGNGSDCKTGCVRGSKCPGLSAGSTRCGGVCRSRLLAWEDPGRERSSRQSVHANPSAAPLKEPRGGGAWERPSLACPARWIPWVRSRVWSGTGSAACSAVGQHLFLVRLWAGGTSASSRSPVLVQKARDRQVGRTLRECLT